MNDLVHALHESARRLKRLSAPLRMLASDVRGNIALRIALIVPGLILLGAGAGDLFVAHTAHARLQDIAESGALAGAPALATDDEEAARRRAASFVEGAMREWPRAPRVERTYEIVNQGDERAIRVLLQGHRPSLLANMLPPGGWKFSGDAAATSRGLVSRDQATGAAGPRPGRAPFVLPSLPHPA